ncbi:unnamed protein product [Phytophthora fragariaefolia]|uniref:Unnamed protein product n=1 Tax=Phytophthora fragariaefolia TaxID=1490495 RepID=A0A9W7D0K4_9STRA|nr:unnamed protein product [Phytophthora fragariaefolia]
MAVMTVSDWALTGSLCDQNIGDILHPVQPDGAAPKVVVTPGHGGNTVREFLCNKTIWAVGAEMVFIAGHHLENHCPPSWRRSWRRCLQRPRKYFRRSQNVVATPVRLEFSLWPGMKWWANGGSFDDTPGRPASNGSPIQTYAEPSHSTHATAERLQQFNRNVASGRPIMALIRREHVKTGHLRITKAGGVTADEARLLLPHLLAHFPELVNQSLYPVELHLHAMPEDHPIVAQIARGLSVSPTAKLTLTTSGADPGTVITISSRAAAVQYLDTASGNTVHVRDIHPSPTLNCMASPWLEKPTWLQKRHIYKN